MDSEQRAQPRLSVVVAAYNVAPYIAQCIESVHTQCTADCAVELIIVIDGATDSTQAIVERVVAAPANVPVRIVGQENQGLSAARNTGLSHVRTEYVTFLDGDDFWRPNYLSEVTAALDLHPDADIVEYDADIVDPDGAFMSGLQISSGPSDSVAEVCKEDFLRVFRCYAWARVLRTSLAAQVPFPVGRRFEDTATTPWLYWASAKTVSIGRRLIAYRQRTDSILQCPEPQDIEDLVEACRNASQMYRMQTCTYWQRVAHRIFQQTCRRITLQPLSSWPESIKLASAGIEGVPAPRGLLRSIQMHFTGLYVSLLYFKRRWVEPVGRRRPASRNALRTSVTG